MYSRIRSKCGVADVGEVLTGPLLKRKFFSLKNPADNEIQFQNYCIRRISYAERTSLVSILASGYVDRILSESFLLHIYAHFSLSEAAHFILIPNTNFRYSSFEIIDSEIIDSDTRCACNTDFSIDNATKLMISNKLSSDCEW
jgi:hypothetical protein